MENKPNTRKAGRPRKPKTGQRVDIYIDAENLAYWLGLPAGTRSELVNRLIRQERDHLRH